MANTQISNTGYMFFDYSAILLLVTIIITTFVRKLAKGKANRYYVTLLFVTLIACTVDIFRTLGLYLRPDRYTVEELYVIETLYLWMQSAIPVLMGLYTIRSTGFIYKAKNSRFGTMSVFIPYLILEILIFTNGFTHLLFEITPDKVLHNQILHFTVIGVECLYIAVGICGVIANRKIFEKTHFISLVVIYPMFILAMFFPVFLSLHRLSMFIYSVAVLIVSVMVVRPEEEIDDLTHFKKVTVYEKDIKQKFKYEDEFVIIMLNISGYDNLMKIWGYETVNKITKRISEIVLKECSKKRWETELYYLGTKKFRIVSDISNQEKMFAFAQELQERFSKGVEYGGREYSVVPYTCLVKCPEDISDFATIMVFGNEFERRLSFKREAFLASDIIDKKRYDIMQNIDRIIEDAFENNEFMVYYQPIYSVQEKKFTSAEALLRLKSEKYGFVSPDIFITAAEKNGAINRIGKFVLEEVCKFIASDEFKSLGIKYIEVNLSVAECMQAGLADDTLAMLKKYGVSHNQINLEITETAVSAANNFFADNIEKLVKNGISISLDDYGTGYSNIERVASLPLKIVKLDRSFTNYKDNPKLTIILKNTVRMLKDMQMEIVVEGVETNEMLEKFVDLECEYIQGYYFSKPVSKKDFIEFINKNLNEQIAG